MLKFLNKKNKKPLEKYKDPKRPLRLSDLKPDVAALFNCSVQKTALEFAAVDMAMDSLDYDVKGLKSAYQPNFFGQEVIYTHFAKNGFIGFQNCAILAQDWLINKCCALPCEDAISIGFDVTLKDNETTPEDLDIITKLKAKDDKFKIKAVCKEFAENKRKFGQSLCIPLVEGANYQLPFNIDAVAPGSYRGMVNIEPIWTTPVLDTDATTNPLSKRFYQPTWFRLPNGAQIHYTWFIFNTYADIPDILKPSYFFGGYPLPQLLYEQVYASEKTANEAPMLAQSKRLNYVEGNLAAYIEDSDQMEKEINLMSWLRNNWGWLFIRRDQRIGQIDTSLTDFDAVTMLGFQLCAAISGVQAARLLETSPKGWQSSGSLEDKNYSKLQLSIQTQDFCPILNKHYQLLAKSEHGINKDYNCVFDPIDTPTEKERAEIKEINSRCDMNYIQAGVISPDEVRGVLREDENSGYSALSEEIEGEENPFGEFGSSETGGSSNEQSPFTSLDAWKESEHPRDDEGKFSSTGGGSSTNKNKNYHKDVEKVIENALNKPNEYAKLEIGDVSNKLSEEAKKNGFNIFGYKHNVDVSGIRHTFKHHGIGKEKDKKQIPITNDDIKKIPEIIYYYDKVTFGTKDKLGNDIIKYQKQMKDSEIFYLEEIRTGRKTLTIKTMYKKGR